MVVYLKKKMDWGYTVTNSTLNKIYVHVCTTLG